MILFKTPAIRLSFVLTLLTVNLLFLANQIGLIADESELALQLRKGLSESLALQFATAAEKGEFQTIRKTLRAVVERNEDIRSAAIRTVDGQLIALVGEHLAHWRPPPDEKSTPTHISVPVYRNGKKWASVEIRFASFWTENSTIGVANSFVVMLAFVGLSSFICFFFIIKWTLRELDPKAVIPERVQKAFDFLQEGMLILDTKEQIVMTNKSFAELLGKNPAAIIGLKGSELGWLDCRNHLQINQLPWIKVLREGQEHKSASLSLLNNQGKKIKLTVNAAKVTDNAGTCRGTLVTFDDITQVEEQNFELNNLVEKLQLANDEIQTKSQELETLANCDPLTLCLNRRSLALQLDTLFTEAKISGMHLSCLMMDIDFFKAVNDNYGHATGDQVIKAVADVLKTSTRDSDLIGRYGGEEFCVALPKLSPDKAAQIAERIRQTIEKISCSGVKITVSIGVAFLEVTTNKPEELINQADKALYAAKNSGRNRVVTWGKECEAVFTTDEGAGKKAAHAGQAKSINTDQAQLHHRVRELEGLLEKRTLEIEHYAMYDFKTGLPTRSLFDNRIAHEIARGKRKNYLVAVLSMTIDTIKRVHETYGYGVAEQLVKACGQRLNDVLREDIDMVAVVENFKEMSTISLINQTEFGILLSDIKQVDHVTWVMKRMLDAFEKPFTIKGNEIYTSAYFGVSIFPHDGQTVDELYSSATNACSYAQKLHGRDRYLFASQNLNDMAVNQLKIENSLHTAIKNKELMLYYQPKMEAATGQVAGFEALLRWKSASLGFIPPDKFIAVAEQSGQIDGIGDWVIYTACQQLRTWLDNGLEAAPIAINLSGVQLRQKNLARRIQNVLDEFNIAADLLEIELTESSLINTGDPSFTILKQIKDMGLRVTMDDFGTGYSSLSYLKNIPLSCLKIDRSFVSDIDKDPHADKLIASIVSMAHGLGLDVVAEGVEEKYQADHLIALGCEYLQGYYFGRPMPQAEAVDLLHQQTMAPPG
jgi:diguanylate cyclase (GGDEF)-like protein/PAS domain S-box-containing protein